MSDWLYEPRPNIKTTVNNAQIKFKDLDCDYNLYSKHNKLLIENRSAINNHIKNLLSTPKGTEEFEPDYGSDLPYRIMDTISVSTAFSIETDILLAITVWMRDRLYVVMSESYVKPLFSVDAYLINLVYVDLVYNDLGVFKTQVYK